MKSILRCYKDVERQGWSGNNKGVLAKKGGRVCWKEEGGERREGGYVGKKRVGKEGREGMLERRGWGKEGYIGKVRVRGTPSNV